jgi:hypothetical protein
MRRGSVLLALLAVAALLVAGAVAPAEAGRPTIMKGCKACHEATGDVVRGKLVSYSEKFKSLQVDVGPVVWIIGTDEKTELVGAEGLAAVPKGKEMSVTFSGGDDKPLATKVSIKQPFELPEEQMVSVEEMMKLAAAGPEKGGYLLVDSRPPAAYASGHLPGAVNVPFPKLKEAREKALGVPQDRQVIFYCGGFA